MYVYASHCIKTSRERAMGPLVVLAYSGGLDTVAIMPRVLAQLVVLSSSGGLYTSAILPWLRARYGARVLCFAADVGQGSGELRGLVEKAKQSGATDCVLEDLREDFV